MDIYFVNDGNGDFVRDEETQLPLFFNGIEGVQQYGIHKLEGAGRNKGGFEFDLALNFGCPKDMIELAQMAFKDHPKCYACSVWFNEATKQAGLRMREFQTQVPVQTMPGFAVPGNETIN